MKPNPESIWPLWIELDRTRARELDLHTQPWKSTSSAVKEVWSKLTDTKNLIALQTLSTEDTNMNPAAREAVLMALAECQKLVGERGGADRADG